jgi:two-component system, NtrC family, nitrogen regulation sensor histidine kinase NtrY
MNRPFHTLLITLLLFALAFSYDFFWERKGRAERPATGIERHLHEREQKVNELFGDEPFFSRMAAGSPGDNDLRRIDNLAEQAFSLFLFQEDSLIFWTGNDLEPDCETIDELRNSDAPLLKRFSGGFYELRGKIWTSGEDTLTLAAAIPLDEMVSGFEIAGVSRGSIPVNTVEGATLFYLKTGSANGSPKKPVALFLYFLSIISLCVLLNNSAGYMATELHPAAGFAFLTISIISLRYYSIIADWTGNFTSLNIFAQTFSTVSFAGSPGDLVINGVLLLWPAIFFHHRFRPLRPEDASAAWKFALAVLNYLLTILMLVGVTATVRMLVLESGVAFDFDHVFDLEIHSLAIILFTILMSISLFLFTHRLMAVFTGTGLSLQRRAGAFLAAFAILWPLLFIIGMPLPPLQLALIAVIYLSLFDLYIDNQQTGFTWLVVWLLAFSAFVSTLLYKYHFDKDRQYRLNYAPALADPRDTLTEGELFQLGMQLKADETLREFFTTPIPFTVEEHLIRKRIDHYFNQTDYLFRHYTYDIFAFAPDYGISLIENQGRESISRIRRERQQAVPAGRDLLFFRPEGAREYIYLLELDIPVPGNPDAGNKAILAVKHFRRDPSRVFNELLPGAGYRGLDYLDKYDFAVYRGEFPVARNGKPREDLLNPDTRPAPGNWKEYAKNQRFDLVYHSNDGALVVIGRNLGGYLKLLSLFSYVFVLSTLTVIVLFLISLSAGTYLDYDFLITGRPSLRIRIQLAVIALTLGSFLIIGLVTAAFFRSSSLERNEARMALQIASVLRDAEQKTGETDRPIDFSSLVSSISKVHNLDIHIYTPDGRLPASSASFIFDRNLKTRRMDARAYNALHRKGAALFVQMESTGALRHNTAYVPLHVPGQVQAAAYLGIPYYSEDKSLRRDLFEFMGALLNVYVFLLLFAAGISIAVANSITEPIAKIGEKLRGLKLGRNEPLEWSGKDEIGELIAEYNHMIAKLEESAERLMQSEREGAWREMAKQVAHEIKNPLTPMKLSIQYLIHAYRSNPQDAASLLDRMSKTLVEQIDSLSQIASEFSNFAQMPKAHNETFLLNELIESAYQLFRENQHAGLEITLILPQEPFTVHADKSHLMRVLANLIKNAAQAIPGDRAGKIVLSLTRENDMAVIKVSDNGAGIPEDMREKVFSPNFTTKSSGMGLGLAISKSIIDSNGGRLYFHTETGEGTDFFVEIPLVVEEWRSG